MTIEEIRIALGNLAAACYKANTQLQAVDTGMSSDGILLTAEQIAVLKEKVKADFAAGLVQAQGLGQAIKTL